MAISKVGQLLYEGMQNKYEKWLAEHRDRLHVKFYERTIIYHVEATTRAWLDSELGAGEYMVRFAHYTSKAAPSTTVFIDIEDFQTILIDLSLIVGGFGQSIGFLIRRTDPKNRWELPKFNLRPATGKETPCYVLGANSNALSFADALAESRTMYSLGWRVEVLAAHISDYSSNYEWRRYNINDEVKDADE